MCVKVVLNLLAVYPCMASLTNGGRRNRSLSGCYRYEYFCNMWTALLDSIRMAAQACKRS